jgi:hypothetical protein
MLKVVSIKRLNCDDAFRLGVLLFLYMQQIKLVIPPFYKVFTNYINTKRFIYYTVQ